MNIDERAGGPGPGALHKYSRRIALSVVAAQLAAALLLALLLAVLLGLRSGYSALVGAAVGVVPTYYLAVRMFKFRSSASAEKTLRGIYLGEGIKVVFTVALFVLAVLLLDVELPVVAAAYVLTVVVNWVMLLRADLGEHPRSNARTK